MKSKLFIKFLISVCVSSLMILTFSACKDREVYANNSDFESYPEYWNSFNENTNGDIFVPDNGKDKNTTSTSSGNSTPSGESADKTNTGDTSTEEDGDYTANFGGSGDNDFSEGSSNSSSSEDSSNANDSSSETNTSSSSENNGPLVIFKN